MTDFTINDHILNQEARAIAEEILTQAQESDDVNELIHQACDGHEWVIYTYKALRLCAECNITEGEAMLDDAAETFTSLSDHASAVAHETLYAACRNYLNELQRGE